MRYIITPGVEIGSDESKIIYVLTMEQVNSYRELGYSCKERRYKVTINYREYEIACTEIWKKGDTEHTVIIPAFLLPRRGYPLDVYVYAINLYCNEPKMSQRSVAEATKKYFGLDKFAHTTIGRAMKKLSKIMCEYIEGQVGTMADGQMKKQEKDAQSDATDKMGCKNKFPILRDTQKRRERIKKFLENKADTKNRRRIMETCEQLVIWWYVQFEQLLI